MTASGNDKVASRDEQQLIQARACVQEYLRELHIQDRKLIEKLATECVSRADGSLSPKDNASALKRRALEVLVAKIDKLVTEALSHLSPKEISIDKARATFLLGLPDGILETLLEDKSTLDMAKIAEMVKTTLPVATPPECLTEMSAQQINFLFFKSAS